MGYYRSFNTNTSLVGEGSWDAKKNRLCAVACRIYGASNSLEKSHVGDCTTRLSLRFPSILSIRGTSTIVGEIWSEKQRNESGFFDRIVFRNADHNRWGIQLQGLKYEYTETDKVNKLCPPKKNHIGNSRGKYPDAYSSDMSFRISIKSPRGRQIGWGSSNPLAVGDQPYQRFPFLIPSSSSRPTNPGATNHSLVHLSYKISLELVSNVKQSSNGYQNIQISAEGFYDSETGSLCMVGCKESSSHSMDCEILVDFGFPPLESYSKGSKFKVSIKSLRETTDPLYFGPLGISGTANYRKWSKESFWRMDLEVMMSVISNTLAIVFVPLQIFYLRKHPGVRPFVSILMLAVLALGHFVPLVLNLEAIWWCNRLFREMEEESSCHWNTIFVLQTADDSGGFKSLCWFDP
ncbi:hypothetical protein PTKIN_Ptkin14bG0139900 [Pterospermum kingtungense]